MTYLGGAVIYYSDNDAPSTAATNVLPAWAYSRSFYPTASDAGVGAKSIQISSPDGTFAGLSSTDTHACTGDQGSYCPGSYTGALRSTSALPEGETYVDVLASDLVGHTRSARSTVRIDKTAPLITQSGTLLDAADTAVAGPKTLHVLATDGTAPLDTSLTERLKARSGVRDVELLVNGVSVEATMPGTQKFSQTCADGSCSWEGDLAFDPSTLSEGRHTVQVRAIDQLGQSRLSTSFDVVVDRGGPQIQFSGNLWDRRDSVTNGTSLTVKAIDGVAGGTAAQERSGAKVIEIRRNGVLISTSPTQTCTAFNCSQTHTITDAAPDGTHTFSARAVDQAGNDHNASFTVTIDRTAPTSPAYTGPSGGWAGDRSYTIATSDGQSGVRYLRHKENATTTIEVSACAGPVTAPCPATKSYSKSTTTLPEGENHTQSPFTNPPHVVKVDRTGSANNVPVTIMSDWIPVG